MFEFSKFGNAPLTASQELSLIARIFKGVERVIQEPKDEPPDAARIKSAFEALAEYGISAPPRSPNKRDTFNYYITDLLAKQGLRENVNVFTQDELFVLMSNFVLGLYAKEFYREASRNHFKVFSFTFADDEDKLFSHGYGPYRLRELRAVTENTREILNKLEGEFIASHFPDEIKLNPGTQAWGDHRHFQKFCMAGLHNLISYCGGNRVHGFWIVIQKDRSPDGRYKGYRFNTQTLKFEEL